ncbi:MULTISPECIES: hypothetical protein [unclassified Wenzhouxiangella]|uniref:hypothetical protein n=1 Tax=unclassified Wenzhouxiangella TaxID=2613841 RepID=UPI000E3292BF|nr:MULTISPECIES: hypothetical protein [unclassified Wenzhouxiangella]RFF27213.1 hypothetical protein DZK25_09560 [Wenzhouxiangella sp. 15181]RFP69101.1 hypothetical protein DZK26_04835 [Wenzhouxiangella sp. 15190]
MHSLERMARQDVSNIQDVLPEDAKAAESLFASMMPSDWDILQSLVPGQSPNSSLAPFLTIRTWLASSPLPVDSGQPEYSMPTAELREQAKNLAKRFRDLAQEMEALFPELSSKQSLEIVIQPKTWLEKTRSLEPTMQECIEEARENSARRDRTPSHKPAVLDVLAAMAKASGSEAEAVETYRNWHEAAQSVESGVKGFCRVGIAPPVVGDGSVLEQLEGYISERAHLKKAPRKPRNNPSWCRHFCHELDKKLQSAPLLANLKRSQKLRVIEFSLHAHARYQGLQVPDSWGIREIERSLT